MARDVENESRPLPKRQKIVLLHLSGEGDELGRLLREGDDFDDALSKLPSDEVAQRAKFLHEFAELANDDETIITRLASDPSLNSLSQVAATFSTHDLVALASPTGPASEDQAGPSRATRSLNASSRSSADAEDDVSTTWKIANSMRRALFSKQPTEVVRKMIEDSEIPIQDEDSDEVRRGVLEFLESQGEGFNLRFTPVTQFLETRPTEGRNAQAGLHRKVAGVLKTVQRIQALTTEPAAIPATIKAGFSSASQIAAVPAANFTHDISHLIDDVNHIDPDTADRAAREVHTRAQDVALHSNMALLSTLQTIRGSSIHAIDSPGLDDLKSAMPTVSVSEQRSTVNLEQLFGTMDYCDCSECSSVTSQAAYFVEILQFLRNNNLKEVYSPGWEGTALELLLRRRPDLADLELTCSNTNVVLPYIDLCNEIMESFIFHLNDFVDDQHTPKQATIDVFNLDEDDSNSTMVPEPANVNYAAYCTLKDAVYPFSLPYHQPFDEIRLLLGHLGTSRFELLYKFRRSMTRQPTRASLEKIARDRACAAEYLLLSPKEYSILTKEGIYPKSYFDHIENQEMDMGGYLRMIGWVPFFTYWGYLSGNDISSTDEVQQTGLSFVKRQFLKRSGITYTDLVDLLRTRYINPTYPSGWALILLQRLRWSYKYLITLLNTDSDRKYERIIAFLAKYQPVAEIFEELRKQYLEQIQNADVSKGEDTLSYLLGAARYVGCHCDHESIWRNWVLKYFESVGQLLVLDSRDGAVFEVEWWLVLDPNPRLNFSRPAETTIVIPGAGSGSRDIGYLQKDGRITVTDIDGAFAVVGHITEAGIAVDEAGVPLGTTYNLNLDPPDMTLGLWSIDKTVKIGHISSVDSTVFVRHLDRAAQWGPAQDTCDIEKVRLSRLDGEPMTEQHYDRMHRFIRLWRKLGWSIDDLDQALSSLSGFEEDGMDDDDSSSSGALSPSSSSGHESTDSFVSPQITRDSFDDRCRRVGGAVDTSICPLHDGEDCTPPEPADMTPGFIKQLATVKELLALTGLELPKLLTFWTDISTHGQPKSLYAQLFLTSNLLGMDVVFAADAGGNYLTFNPPRKLSDHMPVVMAALKVHSVAEMDALVKLAGFPADPDLTLPNISKVYRLVLLAQVLGTKITMLPSIISILGRPFAGGATRTLSFLKNWHQISDSNLNWQQMSYIISGEEQDPLHPLGPSEIDIIKITKQLVDGLNKIQTSYPDITDDSIVTQSLVTAMLALYYDTATTGNIASVLDGTFSYATHAPVGLAIESDLKKLKYVSTVGSCDTAPSASVKMTGILTEEEFARAKTLAPGQAWTAAIDRLMKQPILWFMDTLSGLFPSTEEAVQVLLDGDIPSTTPPPTETDPVPIADPGTAPGKRAYLLRYYIPFLRATLSDRLIVDIMSTAAGLSPEVTQVLVSSILTHDNQSVLESLRRVGQSTARPGADWDGYLVAPSSDSFTFHLTSDTEPRPITLEDLPVSFHQHQDTNVWISDPVSLQQGMLYKLFVPLRAVTQLDWKPLKGVRTNISESAVLPKTTNNTMEAICKKLVQAGIVIRGFSLSVAEIIYFSDNKGQFGNFDLNAVSFEAWKRLYDYTALRDNLQSPNAPLIDLFKWASSLSASADELVDKLIASTRWNQNIEALKSLIQPDYFNISRPTDFQSEINLVKLKSALDIVRRVGVDVPKLFSWAHPLPKFWVSRATADSIRKVIRSRYTIADWEQAVRPLYNTLRENQKNALIAYLLVQKPILDQGVSDADGLFEFFLIDVQMSSCLQTTRIKQAISTVQLFIQRCLLGLELDPNKGENVPARVDPARWSWMEKYRVWEANRKVFLYPENWLIPSLRDDKSFFYQELEGELLQKDVDTRTVTTAFRNYLTKVDEVANLQAEGLFLDEMTQVCHIVSRTRCAPYVYYYRQLDVAHTIWKPWERIDVDIPNYTVETQGTVSMNGTYVSPVVWNGRILIFFPQFAKKTAVRPVADSTTIRDMGDKKAAELSEVEFWEVKMCYTERRDGAWSPKVVSSDGVYESIDDLANYAIPTLNDYIFIPRLQVDVTGGSTMLSLDVLTRLTAQSSVAVGTFDFINGRLLKSSSMPQALALGQAEFSYTSSLRELHTWQASTSSELPDRFHDTPYIKYDQTVNEAPVSISWRPGTSAAFSHGFIHKVLGSLSGSDQISNMFDQFTGLQPAQVSDAFGGNAETKYHELKKPYSIYNWECALHAPMALIDKLLEQKQFDKALEICHFIFNPMVNSNDPSKCWQFRPFQEIVAKDYLENFFQSLTPNKENSQITEWRDNPFAPHVVARSRPVAYMKAIVMKYIQILIDYGDYYFRQNTLEMIPRAIQCYVRASHVYGPARQRIPKRGKTEAQTYRRLLERFDAFSNAAVDLELQFPFSNQIGSQFPVGFTGRLDTPVDLPNIFGSATTRYFCIPDNPQLQALRDTIDDRLFKLRHCQNINGVDQKLPVSEPSINPALLVQATASGLSIGSVLNDLNSPMPNYRFYYLLQKAHEVCADLKSFLGFFLQAKEKKDGEALSTLKQHHEVTMNELFMAIKTAQLKEAIAALEILHQNRLSPVYRMKHFLNLLGEDMSKVPVDISSQFTELEQTYEKLSEDTGLKLTPGEKEEQDKLATARDLNVSVGRLETLAGGFHALPNVSIYAAPVGMGGKIEWGFPHLGHATGAIARWIRTDAEYLTAQAGMAGRRVGLLRAMQDRIQMANSAGYEIKSIDAQIMAQRVRIGIAEKEISNHQRSIDNARDVQEFLSSKYANEELYAYLESTSRQLCYQTYTLAYELAKRAEKVYQFERPAEASQSFIKFGYWNPARDGLTAGESLDLALRQLESAYQETRGHDFEVTKVASLRQIAPLELVRLRETGQCEFTLPEVLFDMDFPGHYMRRIKAVSLSMPCIVGPFVSVNATLRLLEHKIRTSSVVANSNAYPEATDGDDLDPRFATSNIPISAIATSNAQGDAGVFELSLKDERFLPFEGAGAVSRWRLDLPNLTGPSSTALRAFDYSRITDAILTIRYTALDGGDKLASAAAGSVRTFVQDVEDVSMRQGLFCIFDLRAEFPSEWARFIAPPATSDADRVLKMPSIENRLPMYTRGSRRVAASELWLYSSATLPSSGLSLTQTGNADSSGGQHDAITFSEGVPVGRIEGYSASGIDMELAGSLELRIRGPDAAGVGFGSENHGVWIIARYSIRL